jgi:hypothetical protein
MRIGADPEIFLHNGTSFVSVEGKIGGTKAAPLQVPEFGDGYCLQEDNVAVEYNIPPCSTASELYIANIRMIEYIRKKINPYGLALNFSTDALFPEKEVFTPHGQAFGCDPDFNAWEMEVNPIPKATNPLLRSVGGHIHVELPEAFGDYDKINFVRWMDVLVGGPLCHYETSNQRRELYGKAGAMRFKDYGVEYRVPSNVWINRETITNCIVAGIKMALKYTKTHMDTTMYKDTVEGAINRKDADSIAVLRTIANFRWP